MRFDSATFSFLDLLLIKSYKKQKRKHLKEQFQIAHKKQCSKPFFVSGVPSCSQSAQSARRKKFRWPLMVVKNRKRQKMFKNFKTIANLTKSS